ncbi:UPF0158 protein CPn_0518/CP_0235/CPj0518/CpB0539 [Chlamydiales bacterium SCGC AG-110-M15]|nr:UPF0158 protein CPn_0518/CP_0235/CPj0518/CpB0539 [Chlamydiales bacterium SCGC AG-110-M15]
MASKSSQPKKAHCPLILQHHRLMQGFAKADDEKDFYLDALEGFMIFVDLDKSQEELDTLALGLKKAGERFRQLPKFTFFETKKIMEGFVNEKVFDIDTKEKLLDIIQGKEARENFLEFIYDHHTEMEKWQQYYQERSRVRIIEWLRNNEFHFVFEEDLDLAGSVIEKLKETLFEAKSGKEIMNARKILEAKSQTYYSNEALNPRPKRGRPPKQMPKVEVERQITADIYTTVPAPMRPFLFTPEINSATAAMSFSSSFENEEEFISNIRHHGQGASESKLESLNQKLQSLRSLSARLSTIDGTGVKALPQADDLNDMSDVIRSTKAKSRTRPPKPEAAPVTEKKAKEVKKPAPKKKATAPAKKKAAPAKKKAAGKKAPPKTSRPPSIEKAEDD